MRSFKKVLRNTQHIGSQGEDRAYQYLFKQGLRLRCRNYRCKVGEIDLIMRDKLELVFVEVRYRKPSEFASGLESVTYRKQQKIIKAAWHYLMTYKISRAPCRFDVVAVEGEQEIVWVKDAFQLEHFA